MADTENFEMFTREQLLETCKYQAQRMAHLEERREAQRVIAAEATSFQEVLRKALAERGDQLDDLMRKRACLIDEILAWRGSMDEPKGDPSRSRVEAARRLSEARALTDAAKALD